MGRHRTARSLTIWCAMQRPDDPIRAAAEDREKYVAHALLRAWNGVDPQRAIEPQLESALQPMQDQVEIAWKEGAATVRDAGGENDNLTYLPVRKFSIGFEFGRLAPQNIRTAEEWSGRLVREISDDTRATINSTMRDAVREGLGPEETGIRVRDSIGLTAFQARAVANYRRALEQNSPKALLYRLRDRRYDRSVGGETQIPQSRIDTMVERYRQRYLYHRALTIARYETLFAANAGAISTVRATGRDAVKFWLIAPDELVCERCRSIVELQPEGVPLNDPFKWRQGKKGGEVDFSPLHTACRCTV